MAWLSVVGLAVTAAGIVAGLKAPRVTAVWGGPGAEKVNRRLIVRYGVSIALVLLPLTARNADAADSTQSPRWFVRSRKG
jgi:hypothetical protein